MVPAFETNEIALLQGDACAALAVLPAESVQTCVTSPPYYGLRDYGVEGQIGLEESPERYVARLVEVFEQVRRVLKPDGTLWLNIGDSYASTSKGSGGSGTSGLMRDGRPESGRGTADDANGRAWFKPRKFDVRAWGIKPKDLIGVPWLVAFALRSAGWWLRQDLIWHKPNPMPSSVTDRCVSSHEYLFLFAKSERYLFNHEAIREPFADARQARDGARKERERNRGGRDDGFTKPNDIDPSANGGRNRRSVWTVGPTPFKGAHFATFPTTLVEPCVLAGSRPGDVVLDPFNGAGTTGLVARRLGRCYVGAELNPEYVALTIERWKAEGVLAVKA